MPSPTLTLEELEDFFGCTGEDSDPSSPWPYKEVRFLSARGDWEVSAKVYLPSPDLFLSIKAAGHLVYELKAFQAIGVEVLSDPDHRTLKVALSDRDTVYLRLEPRPVVFQSHDDHI